MKTKLSTSAALTASAIILAALVIVQGGRILGGDPVRAEMVTSSGGFTALTSQVSNSQDILLVLDSRSEELLVYRVENQANLELYRKYNVARMMADARARAGGRK
ncbi:MAG: hypothetical protein KF678_12755 [Phycisphaeraceae bacterium]|jgi:hypothetical protein|nr:hypothetical protein [Phycisphaeraceae bacterium]